MKSTAWLARHDLNLTFDPRGRLWRFRPTSSVHGKQPVDAHMDGPDIVVTAEVPGVQPGDIDVQILGDVLQIRGIAARTGTLASDVGLPAHVDMHTIETTYSDGVFEVRVPTRTAVETPSVAPALVAV
jgi:HSP20 family molecular chaperone IbpA